MQMRREGKAPKQQRHDRRQKLIILKEEKDRFDAMRDFFAGVGEGHTAGIWEDVPQLRKNVAPTPKGKPAHNPIGEMA